MQMQVVGMEDTKYIFGTQMWSKESLAHTEYMYDCHATVNNNRITVAPAVTWTIEYKVFYIGDFSDDPK